VANHPNRKVIWTPIARALLYEELRKQFGAHKTWPHATLPSDKEAYHRFLAVFAELVGANSAEAVAHQISFAIQRATLSGEGAQNSILNKAAAFNAHFIDNEELSKIDC
jgi:hypothetical protein